MGLLCMGGSCFNEDVRGDGRMVPTPVLPDLAAAVTSPAESHAQGLGSGVSMVPTACSVLLEQKHEAALQTVLSKHVYECIWTSV